MGQLNKTTEKVNELLDKVDGMPETVKDGKTPVLETGKTTTLDPGQNATSEVVANGEDENGNPKYRLNFGIPKGYDGSGGSGGGGVADSVQWANVLNKPSWVNSSTKPTYTASEVGALPASTTIPSKTSQLTNDSGFTTSASFKTVNGQSIVGSGNIAIEGGGGDTPSGGGGNVNVTNGSALQSANYYAFKPSADGSLDGTFSTIPNANSAKAGLMSQADFSKLDKMKGIQEFPSAILSLTNQSTSSDILDAFGFTSYPSSLLQIMMHYFSTSSAYEKSIAKLYIGNRESFVNAYFDSETISGYIECTYVAEGGKLRTIRINGEQEGDTDSPVYTYSCEVNESGEDKYYLPTGIYNSNNETNVTQLLGGKEGIEAIRQAIKDGKGIYLQDLNDTTFVYSIPVSIYIFSNYVDMSFYHTSTLGANDYIVWITGNNVRHIYPQGYALKSEILTLKTGSNSDEISVAVGGESGLKAIIKAIKDGNRLVIRGAPDESLGFGEHITAFNADVQVSCYLEGENGNMMIAFCCPFFAAIAFDNMFYIIAYNKTENTFTCNITG